MKSNENRFRHSLDDPAVFFTVLVVAGCIFTLVYLTLLGNCDEVYTDIIEGDLSSFGSNKSIERTLVYLLSLFGPLLYFLYFIKTCQGKKIRDISSSTEQSDAVSSGMVITILLVAAGTHFLVYSQTHPLLTAGLLCALLVYAVDKTLVPLAFTFLCLGTYAGIALYRIHVHLGGETNLNVQYPVAVALLLAVLFLLFKNREKYYIRGILLSQCFVPALLLVYLAKNYKYQDTLLQLPPPVGSFCLSTF